jgi:hypothetical protein
MVLFGAVFLKYKLVNVVIGIAFILSGIFFWLGNAMEIESILIIGDIWILLTFCYAGIQFTRTLLSIHPVELPAA